MLKEEKTYYTKFKKLGLEKSLLEYFSHLNLEDWIDFFDDYYNQETQYLIRIIDSPKGEDIYSYGLSVIDDVDSSTRSLIGKANDSLLFDYFNYSKWDLISELFNTVRYLELNVSANILTDIILNASLEAVVREHAAITLSVVHENILTPFWDGLNLEKDIFLTPAYISFFEKVNPIKGLSKLVFITEEPDYIEAYETPILYSLLNISTSASNIEEYKELQTKFPAWALTFISNLFIDYQELRHLKEKVQKPFEDIFENIGLDSSILESGLPEEIKQPLLLLLDRISADRQLIDIVNQKKATIVDPSYISDLDLVFRDVKKELKDLLGNENIYDPIGEQVFEPISSILLYNQPAIFLYPYFLDDYRMLAKGAGVIPYAKQNKMSIVIHKQNPLYYEWQEIRDAKFKSYDPPQDYTYQNKYIDDAIEESVCVKWVIKLIKHLCVSHGSIHTISGYIFDSLIQQFTKEKLSSEEYIKMVEVLREPTPIKRIDTDLPFYKLHDADRPISNHNEILLLDPADALKISNNGKSQQLSSLNKSYFDIVTVKHDLKVSVGIGFTLFALPRLLKNKQWRIIQEISRDKLESKKEMLKDVGIVLNPKPKAVTNLVTVNQ